MSNTGYSPSDIDLVIAALRNYSSENRQLAIELKNAGRDSESEMLHIDADRLGQLREAIQHGDIRKHFSHLLKQVEA